jgi:ribosomal protein S18 acetylase RimI-like enzyme
MQIEKLQYEDRCIRARLIDYLAPHESHTLFLLGNLLSNFGGAQLYAAVEDGQWFGIAGCYSLYKAVSLFTELPEASRALISHAATIHPIHYLSGAEASAEPACRELLSRGYRLRHDPLLTFMELEGQPSYQKGEELCRPYREEDAERVAWLARYLRDQPLDAPITQDDLERTRLTYLRHVLIFNDQIVSIASTNGMGVSTFQILGVATDESFRGRGFAAAVCASLIREMARRGATRCVLFTDRDNLAAQRCYLRMGFHMAGHFYLAKLHPPA